MQYIVTGATSPTGNAVLERLVDKVGLESVTCVVRPSSDKAYLQYIGVRMRVGDVSEPESFASLLNDSTVYIDMTNPRYYHASVTAVVKAGVKRAYFITTTGIFSNYRRCKDIYVASEELIRNSGLTYTILRPSMIYGTLRDRNMSKLIKFLKKHPVFPLFGTGANLIQPVFTDDLADGVVAAIDNPRTENQEYNLAGPEAITYRYMTELILSALGKKTRFLQTSPTLAQRLVQMVQWIPGFPINDEQVLRMQEDKIFDISKAISELGYSPRSFEDGIKYEIEQMLKAGLLR